MNKEELSDAEWRNLYGTVINALSAIVRSPTLDKLCDLDAILRDPVMEQVMVIRDAFDAASLSRRTVPDAAPSAYLYHYDIQGEHLRRDPPDPEFVAKGWITNVRPLYERPDAAPAQDKRDAWFAANRSCELSSDYGPDDDEHLQWVVHRVVGSPNDREWREIGRGGTPSAAIDAAMQSGEKS
jgi:hypothetical protein